MDIWLWGVFTGLGSSIELALQQEGGGKSSPFAKAPCPFTWNSLREVLPTVGLTIQIWQTQKEESTIVIEYSGVHEVTMSLGQEATKYKLKELSRFELCKGLQTRSNRFGLRGKGRRVWKAFHRKINLCPNLSHKCTAPKVQFTRVLFLASFTNTANTKQYQHSKNAHNPFYIVCLAPSPPWSAIVSICPTPSTPSGGWRNNRYC